MPLPPFGLPGGAMPRKSLPISVSVSQPPLSTQPITTNTPPLPSSKPLSTSPPRHGPLPQRLSPLSPTLPHAHERRPRPQRYAPLPPTPRRKWNAAFPTSSGPKRYADASVSLARRDAEFSISAAYAHAESDVAGWIWSTDGWAAGGEVMDVCGSICGVG